MVAGLPPLPRIPWLSENPEEGAEWLPGPDGTVYSPERRVFHAMCLVCSDAPGPGA